MSVPALNLQIAQIDGYVETIVSRIEDSAEHWSDFVDPDDGELYLHEEAIFASCFDGDDRMYDRIRNDYRVLNALNYAKERAQELADDSRNYIKHMVHGTIHSQLRYHGLSINDFL